MYKMCLEKNGLWPQRENNAVFQKAVHLRRQLFPQYSLHSLIESQNAIIENSVHNQEFCTKLLCLDFGQSYYAQTIEMYFRCFSIESNCTAPLLGQILTSLNKHAQHMLQNATLSSITIALEQVAWS